MMTTEKTLIKAYPRIIIVLKNGKIMTTATPNNSMHLRIIDLDNKEYIDGVPDETNIDFEMFTNEIIVDHGEI